jgi:hypothetical protein
MLMEEVNSNNSRTESDRKVHIQNKAFSVTSAELRLTTNKISFRCEVFLPAEGNGIKRLFECGE